MMTVDDFINRGIALYNANNVYAMGMFGQVINKTNIAAKTKQYPNWYTSKDFTSYYNKSFRGYDCICFIKAILWGGTPTKLAAYGSNNVPDVDTEVFYNSCTNKCKPSEAKRGYILHMYNHVGIYLGDGKVLECTSSKKGIAISDISYQKWTGAGKCPYINYKSEDKPKSDSEIKCGDIVQISKGSVYGGLSNTRGMKVPEWVCANKYHVARIQTNKNVKEALISEIYSWVAVSSLKKC